MWIFVWRHASYCCFSPSKNHSCGFDFLLLHSSIGALNHKFFCLFLLYTAVSCIVSLVLLVMRMVHCGYLHEDKEEPGASGIRVTDGEDRLLSSYVVYDECRNLYSNHWFTVLAICSLVFLIFTSAMGCEQLEAIETGKGKIARMKQSVGASGSTEFNTVTEEFNEMFGGDTPHAVWHWYLPLAVQYPRGMKPVVLGYEFNETCLPVPYQERGSGGEEHKEEDALLRSAEEGQVSPPPSPEDHPRSLYSGKRVEQPLPLRRPNSRSNSDSESDGITLVDRTKARLA